MKFMPGKVDNSCSMLTDLPNLLTLSRLMAIPVMAVLMAFHQPSSHLAAGIVFTLAAITDYWDGKLARSRVQLSNIGRMLDPIADKLLVGSALMLLMGQGELSRFGIYPAILIVLREILVSGLREYLVEIQVILPVTPLAKWKTGFQMVAIAILLAGTSVGTLLNANFITVSFLGEALLWVAAGLTLVTGWKYTKVGWRSATIPRPVALAGASELGVKKNGQAS